MAELYGPDLGRGFVKDDFTYNAFGDLLTEALQTRFERDWVGRIDDPDGDNVIAEYSLKRGRVDRLRP